MTNLPQQYFGDIPPEQMREIMDGMEESRSKQSTEDLFDGADVISVYTDAEALEDGVLVAVTGPGGVNRVTRAVFDHFTEPLGASPITDRKSTRLNSSHV